MTKVHEINDAYGIDRYAADAGPAPFQASLNCSEASLA